MIGAWLVGLGMVFVAISVLGLLRFPDLFTRAHALGVGDTLGALLILLGLIVHHGASWLSLKLAVLWLLLFLVNPTVVHAVLHEALKAGLVPWTPRRRA